MVYLLLDAVTEEDLKMQENVFHLIMFLKNLFLYCICRIK